MQPTTKTLHHVTQMRNFRLANNQDKIEKPQQKVGEYVLRAIAHVVSKPVKVYYC